MNKKPQSITFRRAAAELCVSDSTVKRLIRRGSLHTTKPELVDGHWTRRIIWDKSFRAERARRLNGLKAPRRKRIPDTDSVRKEFERKAREKRMNEICEFWSEKDPSPIQTVTPPAEQEPATEEDYKRYFDELRKPTTAERCENAMNICLNAVKDCANAEQKVTRRINQVDNWVTKWINRLDSNEESNTRCTAILATACILQLLLAVYFSLCHFNII